VAAGLISEGEAAARDFGTQVAALPITIVSLLYLLFYE
jgi:hypothetical protein